MEYAADPAAREDGVALICGPKGAAGLSFGESERKVGRRTTDVNAATHFDNVRGPEEYRAGGPGLDWKLFRSNIASGRLTSAPMSLGNAQAALETVIEYTADRSGASSCAITPSRRR